MGATKHAPGDQLPVLITADTSWVVAVFNADDSGHARAWDLYQRLVAAETAVVVCKPLLQIELWSAFQRLAKELKPRDVERLVTEAEERLGGQRTMRLRTLNRRSQAEVRRHLIGLGEPLLWRALTSSSPLAQVRLTQSLVSRSRFWIEQYGLRSHDALYVALAHDVAYRAGIPPHLATLDRDFDVVDRLELWGRTG